MKVKWRLPITAPQKAVFMQCNAKFRIVQKGGRAGFTFGAALAFVFYALQGKKLALWGETTRNNALLYWEDYFVPVLEILLGPEGKYWEFSYGRSKARILNMDIHFRFSANPKTWEGQSYDVIFLNEAGIILQDPYIWTNAVLKSTVQYKDCVVVAAGVPKGRNMFTELIDLAKKDATGRYAHFHFSMFDNPFVEEEEILKAIKDMQGYAGQEVYGDILDGEEHEFQSMPSDWMDMAFDRAEEWERKGEIPKALTGASIDPSLGGDSCVFRWMYGTYIDIPTEVKLQGTGPENTRKVASAFLEEMEARLRKANQFQTGLRESAKTVNVGIDVVGIGSGVYAFLQATIPHIQAIYSKAQVKEWDYRREWILVGQRAIWMWKLKERLDPNGKHRWAVARDYETKRQICALRFQPIDGQKIRLEPKDEVKKRLGISPGHADALLYLMALEAPRIKSRFVSL